MTQKPTDRERVAGSLERRDRIWDNGKVREVAHVQPYDKDGEDRVLVVFTDGQAHRWSPDLPCILATEAEIAQARAQEKRARIIEDIRLFAGWLEQHPEVPAPNSLRAQHSLWGAWDEQVAIAEAAAKALGVEAKRRTVDDGRPCIEFHVEVGDVEYVLYGSGDRPAAQPQPVDPKPSPEPQPAHRMAGAWKGDEPGSCGAECACGVTYDGFDSLNAAVEFVERHVAEANATPIEDAAPRSADNGDPDADVPAGVDGFTHRRGEPGWAHEPSGEQPVIEQRGAGA